MAKIGLNNFRYNVMTEAADGTPTYAGAPKKPGKAISCSVDVTTQSAELWADDELAEQDTSFVSGDITIGIDDEDQEMMGELLGHEVTDGEMVRKSSDVAPYVSVGRVITRLKENVRTYKAEFLYKVKFGEPSQSDTTKNANLTFGTSEIKGKVATLANGQWSRSKVFSTHADAIDYIEGLMAKTQG